MQEAVEKKLKWSIMAGNVDSISHNESDRVTLVLCGTTCQGKWTESGSVRLESAALVL